MEGVGREGKDPDNDVAFQEGPAGPDIKLDSTHDGKIQVNEPIAEQ